MNAAKNLKIRNEYSDGNRLYVYKDISRIMEQIISYKKRDLTRFIGYSLPELREQCNNTLDNLKRIIFYLKGIWILSYNTPKNIHKGLT